MATMVAWNLTVNELMAQGNGSEGGSISYWVEGSPGGDNPEGGGGDSYCWAPSMNVDGNTYNAKATMIASPADGSDPSSVKIEARLHAWKVGDTVKKKGTITLTGTQSNGAFSSTTTPSDPLDDSDSLNVVLATWVIKDGIASIEEHHVVSADLEITDDVKKSDDRTVSCSVVLRHTRQVFESHDGVWTPESDPVVDDEVNTEFALYVNLREG